MKFLDSLVWPMRVWRFLGVAPFIVTRKASQPTKNSNVFNFSIVLLFVNVLLLVLSMIFSSTFIDWSSKDFTKFDDFAAIAMGRIASCFILGEAVFKLNKQINFLKQIMRIDFVLNRKLYIRIDYKKFQFHNNLIAVIWSVCLIACVISISVTFHMIGNLYDERFFLFYIGPLVVYSLNCQRMVLYVYVIRRRYKLLNQFIEKIYAIQEKSIDTQTILEKFEQSSKIKGSAIGSLAVQLISESQLRDIRSAYQMLYDASQMINALFLLSLPLSICIDFHRLLVNIFFVFGVWLLKQHSLILVIALSWGGLNIAHLIMLSHACHTTSKEVSLAYSIDSKCLENV